MSDKKYIDADPVGCLVPLFIFVGFCFGVFVCWMSRGG
jgi:hypothetical protein